ncbi:hypothetical protein AOH328_09000 [Helicobacter pylori]
MALASYPVSNYFTLDRTDEDQAQDYAKRKGWDERDDEMVGGGDEVGIKNGGGAPHLYKINLLNDLI